MSDLGHILPYVIAAFVAVLVWVALLTYLDVFTTSDVRAWRRLAALRGFAQPRSRVEKIATRASAVRRLQDELDLHRLLGIANRNETPLAFLGQATFFAFVVLAIGLAADSIPVFSGQGFAVPPWLVFVIAFAVFLVQISGLRRAARKRQEVAGRSLGDSMMLVAIMTDGRGLQLEDAVRILSRAIDNNHLESIVDRRGFQRLVRTPYRSTIELYRLIAEEYRIPAFAQVADAAANTNVGFSERDTYTRLAKAVYQQRLAEAKMKAARAKILVTLPVAGMLIPLLLLLGAPTFHTITSGL